MWKKTIDIAAQLCTETGIRHVCIDGTTPHYQRTKALRSFVEDSTISVLLMTLGFGALGCGVFAHSHHILIKAEILDHRLNLTAATRIHILEPQWNPAVEEQAIGRAVRIGQGHQTTVIRYIVKDSVEEVCSVPALSAMCLSGTRYEGKVHRSREITHKRPIHSATSTS